MVGWAIIIAIFLFIYFYWDYRRTEKAKAIVIDCFAQSEYKITKMVSKNQYLMAMQLKEGV
jgi:F0F1-type ATP synthase assembly protein I